MDSTKPHNNIILTVAVELIPHRIAAVVVVSHIGSYLRHYSGRNTPPIVHAANREELDLNNYWVPLS